MLELIVKYKKVLLAVGLSVLGIIILSLVITNLTSYWQNRKIDQALSNINAAKVEANVIAGNIDADKQKKIEAQANVNAAIKDLERIQNEVNKADVNSNTALDNINVVNNRNFNGTSPEELHRLRCLAFPEIPECR